MAIKAKGQITLSSVTDVKATYRYYLSQSTTLSKPSKPTTYPPPSKWNDVEPAYAKDNTLSLYFTDCTVFSDDTFAYSEVSLSSSYEYSKDANKTANEANEKADNLQQDILDTEERIHTVIAQKESSIIKNAEDIILQAVGSYTLKNDGLTITDVKNYYIASSSETGVDTLAEGWTTSVPSLSSSAKYLFAYEVVTYTDGSTATSPPTLISTYSSSNVASITEYYLSSDSNDETAIGEATWSTSLTGLSSTIPYLWHYEKLTLANGTTVNTTKRIIGEYQQAFNELVETVRSQLKVMTGEIAMNFTTAMEETNLVNGELQSFMTTFSKYIKFTGETAITIGSGDNAVTLEIDNDTGIVFKKNGVEFGSWDGVDFYTGNIVVRVDERAQFGNFAFVPRSDGSLMFLKVGG